jgi:hypothetical protein
LTDRVVCRIVVVARQVRLPYSGEEMAPTISNSAYAILRALAARGRRLVTTTELREAVGFDPHPMLGRDIVGRRWADPWESPTMPDKRGVQITELGEAAFELGRLERRDALPEPVGPLLIRTGGARDAKWFDTQMSDSPLNRAPKRPR